MKADDIVRLDTINLTTDWQIIFVPINCRVVELTGNKKWYWCSNTEDASREIPAFQKEIIIEGYAIGAGVCLCYVKGEETGTLWRKFTR